MQRLIGTDIAKHQLVEGINLRFIIWGRSMKKANVQKVIIFFAALAWPALSYARGYTPSSFWEMREAYSRASQARLHQIPRVGMLCTSFDWRNQMLDPVYLTVFESEPRTRSIRQLNYRQGFENELDSVTHYQITPQQTYYNNVGNFVQSMRFDGRNVLIERSGGAETGAQGIDNPLLPASHYWVCSAR